MQSELRRVQQHHGTVREAAALGLPESDGEQVPGLRGAAQGRSAALWVHHGPGQDTVRVNE